MKWPAAWPGQGIFSVPPFDDLDANMEPLENRMLLNFPFGLIIYCFVLGTIQIIHNRNNCQRASA